MDENQNNNNQPENNLNQSTQENLKEFGEKSKTSVGPLVGLVIIVILIILGALYLGREKIDRVVSPTINPTEQMEQSDITKQGTSTEISDIEEDLNDSLLNDLDKELGDIDSLFE